MNEYDISNDFEMLYSGDFLHLVVLSNKKVHNSLYLTIYNLVLQLESVTWIKLTKRLVFLLRMTTSQYFFN